MSDENPQPGQPDGVLAYILRELVEVQTSVAMLEARALAQSHAIDALAIALPASERSAALALLQAQQQLLAADGDDAAAVFLEDLLQRIGSLLGDGTGISTSACAQRAQCIGVTQQFERARRQLRAAREVFDIDKRPVGACGEDRLRPIAPEAADLAQPEAQPPFALQYRIPIAGADIDGLHVDAVCAAIRDQLRRRVKSHRLAVEQRAGEGRRKMAFQP